MCHRVVVRQEYREPAGHYFLVGLVSNSHLAGSQLVDLRSHVSCTKVPDIALNVVLQSLYERHRLNEAGGEEWLDTQVDLVARLCQQPGHRPGGAEHDQGAVESLRQEAVLLRETRYHGLELSVTCHHGLDLWAGPVQHGGLLQHLEPSLQSKLHEIKRIDNSILTLSVHHDFSQSSKMVLKHISNDNFCVVLMFDVSFAEEDCSHLMSVVQEFLNNWI